MVDSEVSQVIARTFGEVLRYINALEVQQATEIVFEFEVPFKMQEALMRFVIGLPKHGCSVSPVVVQEQQRPVQLILWVGRVWKEESTSPLLCEDEC